MSESVSKILIVSYAHTKSISPHEEEEEEEEEEKKM